MTSRILAAFLALACLWPLVPCARAAPADGPRGEAGARPAGKKELTDEDVVAAIEKGRKYLVGQAKPNGAFASGNMAGGLSALVFMTLAYMGEHPNRDHMAKGMQYLMDLNCDTDFNDRQGYALPIRVMGLSYVYKKLLGDNRRVVGLKAREDIMRMQMGQATTGGWRYKLQPNNDYDFSVTQWPILAMRDAERAGIEFPDASAHLRKALDLYLKFQQSNGGWCYQGNSKPAYGSMTAAGLASLFIIADLLEPGSGCPCLRGGTSPTTTTKTERAMDASLEWLSKHFDASKNPTPGGEGHARPLYWLYCVERVGIAAGYKYFGTHNWYKEGAADVISKQKADGSWGGLDDTCFALLFLYKGRAPILFNKLKFDGTWNAHRRDIANLTHFIEQTKEQMFHWQIVELRAPLEELHDAPILYITAETEPKFSEDELRKLRRFTDTGGTILFEASCGNPNVRRWFTNFAESVWPETKSVPAGRTEWKLVRLDPAHPIWEAFHKMKTRPEVLGVDDGVRTVCFYSPDDVSCAWQTKALTQRMYLFDWGINLVAYATDQAPLRAKLAGRIPPKTDKYKDPVKPGPRTTLQVARVRYSGNWEAGANYRGFVELAQHLKAKAGITLQVTEAAEPPFIEGGVALADLAPGQVAYLAGSRDFALKPDEKEALKKYLDAGGFLWVEAVTGAQAFDQAFRKAADEMGWQVKLLPGNHPLLHGRMDGAEGYNLTVGVEFRRALRQQMIGRPFAQFYGLYEGETLRGLYSPFDVVFSATGLEANDCRGYRPEDAAAVATNLALYLSTRK